MCVKPEFLLWDSFTPQLFEYVLPVYGSLECEGQPSDPHPYTFEPIQVLDDLDVLPMLFTLGFVADDIKQVLITLIAVPISPPEPELVLIFRKEVRLLFRIWWLCSGAYQLAYPVEHDSVLRLLHFYFKPALCLSSAPPDTIRT